MSYADVRATVAAALDVCADLTPADVHGDIDSPRPGWTTWRCGRMFVTLPSLLPAAPESAQVRYWARIVAGLSGRCPLCGTVLDIVGPSDPARVAWWVLPIEVALVHRRGCPALFGDAEADLFDARAWEMTP